MARANGNSAKIARVFGLLNSPDDAGLTSPGQWLPRGLSHRLQSSCSRAKIAKAANSQTDQSAGMICTSTALVRHGDLRQEPVERLDASGNFLVESNDRWAEPLLVTPGGHIVH